MAADDKPRVFVSVGRTFRDDQEQFVEALFRSLHAAGVDPHALNRTDYSHKRPLQAVEELMQTCDGTVIVAFERLHIDEGSEKRLSPDEEPVHRLKVSTAWNQVEAAMAYVMGHPLLVLVEEGCRTDGLLEASHDWHVRRIELTPRSLQTPEVLGEIASWRDEVQLRAALIKAGETADPQPGLQQYSFAEVLRAVKPGHVAALVGLTIAWATLVAAVVANLS